ncbi:hypothetical protein DYBT9623_02014 [Dyadobacter sp. CECT 9623]|uniref:Lipocalin-like domain-containing protein n=1 Tax=Dyadobacter linearis TaxID=2823330 RepID=A0ABM8UP59_9BACT|nr:hypothetical protein [Dyadobacter sp. CECT 9623]CAG5069278.1 hypothetical protein DYBT9623_02014 [Dyadobacter sp. CECT 9623]
MKTVITGLIAAVMAGCFPERYSPEPTGDLVYGEKPGYWTLVGYQKKGKNQNLNQISGKALLEVEYALSIKDSLQEPQYHMGAPYYIFSFFDSTIQRTNSLQAVIYGSRYDRKRKRSQYWYHINKEYGFAAFLDVELGKETITHRVELSNVMKSATYKPELDSLRYIYEPTAKFK